jgi:D-proline reductase (dithiol) PrdB
VLVRRTHPSFVRYIDKSREYYAAHGYDKPYAWAHYDAVPFQALAKPLAECRIGLGTTADRAPRSGGREAKLYAEPMTRREPLHTEMFWDRDATHTDDPESFLPRAAMGRLRESGRVRDLSARFYGLSTDYSQRQTIERDAPQIEAWMREDGVDAAILVAL